MTDQEYCVDVNVELQDICDKNNEIKETAELLVQTGEELKNLLRVLLSEVAHSPDTERLINQLVERSTSINQSMALSWSLTICVKIFKWRIWVTIKKK